MPGGVRNVSKGHAAPSEAFACHSAWLVSQGFRKIGGREFETPEGTIRVLTKRSKFGARVRGGKTGGEQSNKRGAFYRGRKGGSAGTIIST